LLAVINHRWYEAVAVPQRKPSGKRAFCTNESGTAPGTCYLDGPDGRRIQWYREVLAELARAIADGARVRAFHAWTLLDNFQWAEGYTERYGLIYTDFRNQKRTTKDSGLWYARVAASNRLDV